MPVGLSFSLQYRFRKPRDRPHVRVLIRGRTGDGQDLVISRAYISRGFRDRAAERVTMELGPRSEREIRSALEKEVEAERWTSLDRALRDIADGSAGIADLRPGAPDEDPELRRLIPVYLQHRAWAKLASESVWCQQATQFDRFVGNRRRRWRISHTHRQSAMA